LVINCKKLVQSWSKKVSFDVDYGVVWVRRLL